MFGRPGWTPCLILLRLSPSAANSEPSSTWAMLLGELMPTVAWSLVRAATVLYGEFGRAQSAWLASCRGDGPPIIRMSMGLTGAVAAGFFAVGVGAANLPGICARMNET